MYGNGHRLSQCLLAFGSVFVSACAREQPVVSAFPAMSECVTSQLGSSAVARMTSAFVDSLNVYRADTEVMDDGVAFTMARDHQVVLTDRAYTTRVVLGQKGGGPGDLSGPQSVRPTETGIAVLEAGNQRVSFWTWDGEYLHSVRVGSTAETFAVDDENHVYSPSNVAKSYVLETSEGMVERHWGKRVAVPNATKAPNYFFDMVARTPDGTLLVFDNTLRLIIRVSSDGSDQQAYALPATIESAIAEEVARTNHSFESMGMRGYTAALRTFRTTDDGRLFIRTIGDGPFAMLVNPVDMSCSALTLPQDSTARAAVKGAYSMMVADSTLFVASVVGSVLEFPLPSNRQAVN